MCKFLGLRFLNYKVMIYSLIFFGLGPKLETDQVSQPPTPPYPPNLVWRTKNGRSLGQINFRTTSASVGFECFKCGKYASRCNIMDGEGRRFTRDDSIHSLCICTMIKDGMGCWIEILTIGIKSLVKTSWTKQLRAILDFHESKMIHGR